MNIIMYYTKEKGAFFIDKDSIEYRELIDKQMKESDERRRQKKLSTPHIKLHIKPTLKSILKPQQCYFISDAPYKFIKIGRSDCISKRLKQIQTYFHNKVELLHTTTKYSERDLHKKFEHLRQRGEWFEYTDEIKKFIEEDKKNI